MAVPMAGALAVIEPPARVARFAARRGYLPLGVPMLKHIEALPGQQVCRVGRVISVNGRAVGAALERDREDAPCQTGRAAAPSPPAKSSS